MKGAAGATHSTKDSACFGAQGAEAGTGMPAAALGIFLPAISGGLVYLIDGVL